MRRIYFALLAVASAALFSVDIRAADKQAAGSWPQWRGAQRDGISEETGLLKDWKAQPPKLVWMAEGIGGGYASVSVADGKIFTTGNVADGQAVFAIQASDGKILWQKKITDSKPKHDYEGSRSTPTVDGDRIYLVPSSGGIACLKVDSSEVVWQRDFKEFGGKMMSGWGFSESPLVDGDLVLCTPGGQDAMIVAFDKLTGKDVWKSAVPKFADKGKDGAGYSSIVISQGAGVKQYVQLAGRGVFGVRASDGKFLWGYGPVANGVANISTPLVTGDYIFCSTAYGTGSALVKLEKEGDEVKAKEEYFLAPNQLQNHHGGMILKDGYVYCGQGQNEGFPICIQLDNGKIVWGGQRGPVGKGSAAVVCADGNLIFRYQSGDVVLIGATPEGFKMHGSFIPKFVKEPSWAHPVVAGGKLYLREQDKLMCYDLKP